ncbi:RNA 2'-phosphotransferase [Neorhizobium alkalisoli]|uniref:Probable RNA 2'-phosphotransferase n=1 Tax=Neorhizobium alkalisoli TaxID=528178 RepID=A0A561QHP0_9HYPH|nr:RNA 2'-phosphotransferase [Neorhizobium alkalisoli]TWF49861.1 putative RNA 2'-phosphotransferase [Neorhizobium alkalisoli]
MSKEISKLLSHVLRHAPERLGIELDANGWTSVDYLIGKARQQGIALDRPLLENVVATSDKKRFTLSEDGTRIRAAQGHSVAVELGLAPAVPPDGLFHGTARDNLDSILRDGLKPGSRQHVHLSHEEDTAIKVGSRHGKPIVLKVDTGKMHRDGFTFYRADNGVWLTDSVPPSYLGL